MGTLKAKAYPTKIALRAADHTYVVCGTGKKAWGCWGGKSGGSVINSGTGSSLRADKIAAPDERAGIKCYLVNGVCHQAANRVLLPAGIIVSAARGYRISQALFGTYGRVGSWPCRAPFNQHRGVTGDLLLCISPRTTVARRGTALTPQQRFDWAYLQKELEIYGNANAMFRSRSVSASDMRTVHQALFMHMAEFQLGPMLDRPITTKLRQVRRATENKQIKFQLALSAEDMKGDEYVELFNKETIRFQEEMANVLSANQYASMFELDPSETVVLADPQIVKKVFKS